MSLKTYSISTDVTGAAVNPTTLHAEIEDSGHVTGFDGLLISGDDLSVLGSSLSDETQLDTLIQNHEAESLDALKLSRYVEIDSRTKELIGAGFSFDGNQFSLSTNAQLNWVGLKTMKDILTWPVDVTTLDDNEYSLAEANLDSFVGYGLSVVQAHLDSGRALKVQIHDATTKAEVDAVVDTR